MSKLQWLQTALQAASYVELRKMQSELASLHAIEMQRALRQKVIEIMRNIVFETSKTIRQLSQHVEQFPLQVYVISRFLEWRMKDAGITVEAFSEIQDKEYLFQTQNSLQEIIRKSSALLDPVHIEKGERALQMLIELPLLQRAITVKRAEKWLKDTEIEWRKLSNKRLFYILGWLGLPIGCLSSCCGFSLLNSIVTTEMRGGPDDVIIIGIMMGLCLLAPLGVTGVSLFSIIKGNTQDYQTLKQKRERWRRQSQISEEEKYLIIQTIGDRSLEEYESMLEVRKRALSEILGDRFYQYLPHSEIDDKRPGEL